MPIDYAEFRKELGKNIALRRKHVGLNQAELAAKVKIDQTTMSQIENGKGTLSVERLLHIASFLECRVGILFPLEQQNDSEKETHDLHLGIIAGYGKLQRDNNALRKKHENLLRASQRFTREINHIIVHDSEPINPNSERETHE